MYQRKRTENENRIAVDIQELQSLLSLGRNSAAKIGVEAGAAFSIGKRRLYNVEKVRAYIDAQTAGDV